MGKKIVLTKKIQTMSLWNKASAFIRQKSLFSAGSNILLAVSGGPDSMAMLDYFARHRKNKKLRLMIAHVNHHLRGKEAEADADFVREAGQIYKIKTIILSADVKKISERDKCGIENAARKARYKLLLESAIKYKFTHIAIAHNCDDNAETFLLNLLRGTNPKGLSGIPAERELYKAKGQPIIKLIRPFLAISRKEIENYLQLNGIPSRIDRTNKDERYTRNWIRLKLLPMLEKKQPRIKLHLVQFSEKIEKLINCLEYKP